MMEILFIALVIFILFIIFASSKSNNEQIPSENQNKNSQQNFKQNTTKSQQYKFYKPKMQRQFFSDYKKEKGTNYEFQIGEMFKNKGFKVYFNGVNHGKNDKGIDLIAHKNRTTILVQCKNWERTQVTQQELRIFLGDCTAFCNQNLEFLKNRHVKYLFVTSCPVLDYGVKKFLEENKNIIYKIVPYDF